MNAFEYAAPATVEDAVKLLGAKNAEALSGGTDLLGRMKDHVAAPERVVYLKGVQALRGISGDARAGLTIGAGTTLADLLANQAVRESYPALWQAAFEVGTPQIRNMATVGGNLLQRPRCWYFRAGNGLLALKDGESLVRRGDNRHHAVFLTDGNALFVNPSSLATPLFALGAQATVVGAMGERTLPVEKLYQIPRNEGDRELTIAPGEVLTRISIPAAKGRNASYEVRQKQAHDWPIVMASVQLDQSGDGTARSARVVLYGVAPIPWRSEAAETAITGKKIDRDSAAAAGEAAAAGAKPLSMNAYKIPLVKTVVKRAILAAVGDRYWEA